MDNRAITKTNTNLECVERALQGEQIVDYNTKPLLLAEHNSNGLIKIKQHVN